MPCAPRLRDEPSLPGRALICSHVYSFLLPTTQVPAALDLISPIYQEYVADGRPANIRTVKALNSSPAMGQILGGLLGLSDMLGRVDTPQNMAWLAEECALMSSDVDKLPIQLMLSHLQVLNGWWELYSSPRMLRMQHRIRQGSGNQATDPDPSQDSSNLAFKSVVCCRPFSQ